MGRLKKHIALLCTIILLFCSACTDLENNDIQTTIPTTQKATTTETIPEEKISVYAGPGEDYIKLNNITAKEIKEYLKYENNWIEIEYGSKRGYVPVESLEDIDINKIPHVVHTITQNVYPYPTIYNSKTNLTLFDDANMYYMPKTSGTPIKIDSQESVTILYPEKAALKTYIQIEFNTDQGKRRGYCDSVDLLSLDNPLLNFDEVKQKNACISYNGENYYSATGDSGWNLLEEKNISKTEVDWLAGIVGIIAGNDINNEAIESTEGTLQLYSTKDRQYINANTSNESIKTKMSIADFILGSTISFLQSGVNTTTLNVRLNEYEGEKQIVIRMGTPIEFSRAGKKTDLSSLIVERDNTALTLVESNKRADEMIKKMYPHLNKNKTYSMQMTFSKDFEINNYGYYIVIDNNCDVYAVPIIHTGTSFLIYCEDGFVRDATWDLATSMIKVDEKSKEKILTLLVENGFDIEGFEYQKPKVKIPSDALEHNGHQYKIFSNVCDTWEEAKEYCENIGGHLAIISSKNENDALYKYLIDSGYETAYFGYSDSESEGIWKWVLENESSYTNWHSDEPNNDSGGENYAELYWKFPDGTWNDGNFGHGTESDSKNFICEWD